MPSPLLNLTPLFASQLVEPELLPGDVRAALQSEYNTSYNTKSENTTLNHAVVHLAAAMENRTRTAAQTKTSVLSKMMNAITKTVPYPLVMSAAYLLGYGDSWCPMRVARHDFSLFQRSLLQRQDPYDDLLADHTFAANATQRHLSSDDSDKGDSGHDGSDSGESSLVCLPNPSHFDMTDLITDHRDEPVRRHVKAIDDATLYQHRHDSLTYWSPFELTMGFTCEPIGTADSKLFPMCASLGTSTRLAHKPRLNRAKVPVMPVIAIPQPTKEHPKRPSPDAPSAFKEQYAAWALGNFFSDRLHDKLQPEARDHCDDLCNSEDLRGHTSLWSMFRRWERRHPRGDKDLFAFRCLHNIELRLEARSLMRDDSNKRRLLQRQILQATPRDAMSDGGSTSSNSSSDSDVSLHSIAPSPMGMHVAGCHSCIMRCHFVL